MQTEEPLRVSAFLNRVPEVTIFFWIIKVLGTTVGETAADFLNVNLNLGLTVTSVITGALLAGALFVQFRAKRYVPSIYWSAVVLISIFGTLVTDNLTDVLNVPLEVSTVVFSVLLAGTFAVWYWKEKNLSMHSIVTAQREAYYWLAILFTFALGTAAGDLLAEGLGLGYFTTGIIVAVAIAAIAVAWRFGLNAVLSFWLIYILTRPLGASIGDLLTQPHKYGGLGLGTPLTSALFIAAIVGTVLYLSVTKKDVTSIEEVKKDIAPKKESTKTVLQVAVTLGIVLLASSSGYLWYTHNEQAVPLATPQQPAHSVEDYSPFTTISQNMLAAVSANDAAKAKAAANDLEHEWDVAESRLKPLDRAKWTEIDDAIDAVLREVRSVKPNKERELKAIHELLTTLS
ncbi:hypothetical protein KKH15_03155 [Patescibacteria group bacterium]|nr:hypothetical protein [Patescibacteria group bacterium]MBU1754791.1 hypothetical protein [Patescibacteria group bacterium]